MAISTVLRELKNGNDCTLVWYDPREESGLCVCDMTGLASFEDAYRRFSYARVVPEDMRVTNLTRIVRESVNVTIRIVTSNLDPISLSEYNSIPAMFGGAGTGCITEVLLFNPEERYTNISARREYVSLCRTRLMQGGVVLTELRAVTGSDGKTMLRSVQYD